MLVVLVFVFFLAVLVVASNWFVLVPCLEQTRKVMSVSHYIVDVGQDSRSFGH